MSDPSFFAELKRRNVLRVAAFYAGASWLLAQVATQVLPVFEVSPGTQRIIVVLLIIGFPIALLLSWFYELTPQGLVRESEIERSDSIARKTGKALDRWIIGVLVLVVLVLLADKFLLRKDKSAVVAASTAANTTAPAMEPFRAKSIAVLPFESLSEDKANAYFASGMQDEILTRLAGIRDLKVISRTSTEQYASRPPNLRIVGEQLGVAAVLEGSVQRSGENVHINVQLIDAQTDTHLWAESYDREIKDLFAVERDVAEKVAEALKAHLLPEEAVRVATAPTLNPTAYDLYLRANAHANRAYDQDILVPTELPPAIALYEQALAEDRTFALAAAALSRAHISMYFNAPDRTELRLAAAKAAAEQALALQAGLGEGHYALGLYWYWGHRDYAQASQQLELASQSLPNSADVAVAIAAIARRQGQFDQALAVFEQAAVLDPRSALSLDQLAITYSLLRRYAEADQAFARAATLTADPADELVTRAINTVAWKGDLAPLRASLGAIVPGSDPYTGNTSSFFTLASWSRDHAAAIRIAETDAAVNWSDQNNVVLPRLLFLAWAHTDAGDNSKARPLYAAARTQIQAALARRPDEADLHLALGFAAAGLGLKDESLREGRKAASLMPLSRDALTGAAHLAWLARLYVRVGENDAAIDLLKQLLAIPAGLVTSPALLKLDPIWDPLRGDARFQKLQVETDVKP